MVYADILSCEWNPGSNRSMVDPVAAIARLDIPADIKKSLVEKFNKNKFDDIVTIDWAEIKSDHGINKYGPDISEMNFGNGRLCHKITRAKWKAEDRQGAIIFIVDGMAFGYAAACGNLFMLPLVSQGLPYLPPIAGVPIPDSAGGPLYPPMYPVERFGLIPPAAPQGAYTGQEYSYLGAYAFGAGGSFGGGEYVFIPQCCDTIYIPSAVPEPSVYAFLLAGFSFIGAMKLISTKKLARS